LFSHLCGYLAINYALGHLSAASVSVSILAQPVITALISIPLLGEFLSLQQVIGGTVVLIGIYLVNRRSSMGGKSPAAPQTV
jgi:drug/metabolite transporter (DMT)-like permease